MTVNLRQLVAEAEAVLSEADQEDLAHLIESFLSSAEGAADFTPEELEHIRRISAEPFVPADPARVAAFFAGRD